MLRCQQQRSLRVTQVAANGVGQYLGSNPQRQHDPPQQLSTCCPGRSGNITRFMNRNKLQKVLTSRRDDLSL